MSERKNKTVTTPSNHTVVLKEYISAGEFLDINDAKEGAELTKTELAKRLVSIAIVSIDGGTENLPDLLRNLPLGDYLFLSKEVTKIVNGDFTEAKSPVPELIWHDFFALGRAYLPAEMKAILLCREMKWDWLTYRAQPHWFVTNLLMMLQAESEEVRKKSK